MSARLKTEVVRSCVSTWKVVSGKFHARAVHSFKMIGVTAQPESN